ncbi:MAG: TolC family protein [Candidatus Aureabacteria bacterium]|nr:TolC family protein [Candidatus Auribacterota bacterium]
MNILRPYRLSLVCLSMFFAWGVVPPAYGESGEEETVTWADCVAEAKRNNPNLQAAEASLRAARAEEGKASSNFYPQVSGRASASQSKSSGEESSDSYGYSVSASQLLFDGLKTWYDRDRQEQNMIAAEASYDSTSADVRQSLRDAFIELLRGQELSRISQDIAKRRQQQADLIQLRYNAGREHKGALLTAQANLRSAEADIVSAQRAVIIAQRNLHAVLGREVFTPLRAEGEFDLTPLPPQYPDFEALLEGLPAVRKSTAEKTASEYSLKSAGSDFSPSVTASGSLGRSGSDWPPSSESWSVGVSLSVPIFEGTSKFYELKRARASLDNASASLKSQWETSLYTLYRSYNNLLTAYDQVEVQGLFFEASRERSKIGMAQYTSGLLIFDNWIIIEDDLVRAERSLVQARADALYAETQWLKSRGQPLE